MILVSWRLWLSVGCLHGCETPAGGAFLSFFVVVAGPDCFRHYEMMLEGNIALVPDVYSIRRFMEGLPAFFFGGAVFSVVVRCRWGLTCPLQGASRPTHEHL